MLRNVVFIGAPGVGKGTFAGLICRTTGWSTISVGEKMREEVRAGTELGLKLAARLKNGELIEDEVVNALAFKFLDNTKSSTTTSTYGERLILDGFPRTVGQSEALVRRCLDKRQSIWRLIYAWTRMLLNGNYLVADCVIIVTEAFNVAHIVENGYDMPAILPANGSCEAGADCMLVKRNDDTPESIENRFAEYAKKTTPIIKFFEDRGILESFEVKKGVKDTPALLDTILQNLQKFINGHQGVQF